MSKLTDQDLDAIEGRVNPATQPEDIYSLLADLREARARIAALEAEVARMRPVVEAARQLCAMPEYTARGYRNLLAAVHVKRLRATLAALDAAQKAAREG